jgi:hypothetical protein
VRSTINEHVFREPDGRPVTLVYFGAAVAFLSMEVYYDWFLGSTSSGRSGLMLMVLFGLLGIAESLPESRRQIAGILRLTVLFLFLCLLVATVFAPGFIYG